MLNKYLLNKRTKLERYCIIVAQHNIFILSVDVLYDHFVYCCRRSTNGLMVKK